MEENKKYKIYKTTMLIAITIFITFMITSISLYTYFKRNPITTSSTSNSKDTTSKDITSKLKSYRQIIDKYYLGEVDEEKLEEGAIKGYIEGLGDPNT